MPGPPPKRSDQRRRRNAPAAGEPRKAAAGKRSPMPKPDPKWHSIAKRWYLSLGRSGQAAFYEPSDWAAAAVLAESMSRELNPQTIVVGVGEDARTIEVTAPPKGATLAAWLKGMSMLLVTEAVRRRAAVELEQGAADPEEGAGVTSIDAWRSRIDGTG